MKRAFFITYLSNEYSRSAVLASALKKYSILEVDFFEIEKFNSRGISKLLKFLRTLNPDEDILIVMSPSHLVTVPARLFFKGKVILDAGWPLSDSSIIRKGKGSFSYFRDSLIDRISFFHGRYRLIGISSPGKAY